MRVTFTWRSFSSRLRYIAVASPSRLGLVQRITSATSSSSMPREQLAHAQLLGTDPLDRADGALQHVVAPVELLRLLHRDDVARLLHHAEHGGVAPIVGAQVAQRALGDVEALLAERHAVLRLGDGAGQAERVDLLDLQQVERDPLRGLRADPRKAAELVDELLHRLGVDRHQPAPKMSPSPASGPIASRWISSSWAFMSCRAATTRSSSMATSSGSTTCGSIETLST